MTIRDKAWSLWSIWIRKRDKATCYTCGKRFWDEEKGEYTIKGLEAGHFKHGVLDFDPMNIHAQCTKCNKYFSGRLDVYAENLIRDYGIKSFTDLCNRAKQATKGHKYTEQEYRKIIEQYK